MEGVGSRVPFVLPEPTLSASNPTSEAPPGPPPENRRPLLRLAPEQVSQALFQKVLQELSTKAMIAFEMRKQLRDRRFLTRLAFQPTLNAIPQAVQDFQDPEKAEIRRAKARSREEIRAIQREIYPPLFGSVSRAQLVKFAWKVWEKLPEQFNLPWARVAITISLILCVRGFFPYSSLFFSNAIRWPLHMAMEKLENLSSNTPFHILFNRDYFWTQTLLSLLIISLFNKYSSKEAQQATQPKAVNKESMGIMHVSFALDRIRSFFHPKPDSVDDSATKGTPLYEIIISSLYEELVFMIILPKLFKGAVYLGAGLTGLIIQEDLSQERDWIIQKIETIFCSVLFGIAHPTSALLAGWRAVRILYPLKHHIGSDASLSSNMPYHTGMFFIPLFFKWLGRLTGFTKIK